MSGGEVRCPRCGSGRENFHRGYTTRQLTCRWCVYVLWLRTLEHDLSRLIDEAERSKRDAA